MKLLKIGNNIVIAMLLTATLITRYSESEDGIITSNSVTSIEKNAVKKSNNLTVRYGNIETIFSNNPIYREQVVISKDHISHKNTIIKKL